jgi:hypothetical protein
MFQDINNVLRAFFMFFPSFAVSIISLMNFRDKAGKEMVFVYTSKIKTHFVQSHILIQSNYMYKLYTDTNIHMARDMAREMGGDASRASTIWIRRHVTIAKIEPNGHGI